MHFARPRHSRSGRRTQRWFASALALGVFASMVGCTGSGSDAPPVRTTVEKIWTAAGIDPVSQVDEIGGVAVVYGTTPTGLMIYGLDPATGAQLWSKPTIVGPTDSGNAIWTPDLSGTVTYFRPTGTDRLTQLVLADPKTGADKSVSEARYWSTYPPKCSSDDTWICVSSHVQYDTGSWGSRTFKVNQATGQTIPLSNDAAVSNDEKHGLAVNDLYYTTGSDTEPMKLGRWVDDAALWEKPMSDFFGPGLTSPKQFEMPAKNETDLGTLVAWGELHDSDGDKPIDLATNLATAVFSLADGSVTWASQGAWLGCGSDPLLGLISWHQNRRRQYLCHYTGSATKGSDSDLSSRLIATDLDVTVEKVDETTGVPVWSAKLGDAKRLVSDTSGAESAILDDKNIFEPNSTGGLVLNLDTGQTRPPTAEDTFWCQQQEETFTRTEPVYDESTPVFEGRAAGTFRPCTMTGADAPLPTSRFPSGIGASFDNDVRVVALAEGVSGFLQPTAANNATESDQSSASGVSVSTPPSSAAATSSVPSTPEQPPTTVVEQAWIATGFEAKTKPTIVAGTAVLYGVVGADLFLIGLDPTTGAERWRRKTNYTAYPPSQEISVVQVDDRVAYLRGSNPEIPVLSEIVMIDPATGTDMVAAESRWWIGLPAACADDDQTLCATAYYVELNNSLTKKEYRIDKITGSVTSIPGDKAVTATGYTTLWNDVVKIDNAPVETIGIVKDGKVLWSRPLTDIAGAGATLDGSWYLSEDDGPVPVVTLSAVTGWSKAGEAYPALDLAANTVSVGFNRDTGAVLWTEPGTWGACRSSLWAKRDMSTPGSYDPQLRCRYTGRLDSDPPGKGYDLKVPSDLTVTLERVDLQTGKPVWSVPLGATPNLAVFPDGETNTFLDDHRLLINSQIVDVDDGSTRTPAPGETFWCPAQQFFVQNNPWTSINGTVSYEKQVEGSVFLCDAGSNPVTATPTAVPLAVSTVTDDGLRLVSTKDGVIAYRVPL